MTKLDLNGHKLEWKTVTFVAWCIFVTGGAWMKLEVLETKVDQELNEVKLEVQTQAVLATRQSVLEERMDNCCPHARALLPKDLLPPLKSRDEIGAILP